MELNRAGRLAWLLCAGLFAGCTGNTLAPGPGGGKQVALEITEAFTQGTGQPTPRTSFLSPQEQITVRARLINAPSGAEQHIRWTVRPAGPHTGPAVPASLEGKEITFRASSANGRAGSRQPNPPLQYEVTAAATVEGQTLQAHLPPTTFIRQDEPDILRQEYADYGTRFQPSLTQVSVPRSELLNTGNYPVIVEEESGKLEALLAQTEQEVNRLLNDDVQEQPPGTRGLSPDTVVVSPGPAELQAGPLGDTNPQGDDVCAAPLVNGACESAILAGPNGIAETSANNRKSRVDLSKLVTSGFRNPQRNKAAGSQSLNSRHIRGRALDLDPRSLSVQGKDSRQLMCIIEAAGDHIVGPGNSFTERGAATFLDCNDVASDHVHIQR